MKFSLPTNWQPELLPALKNEYVDEIYGKLQADAIGGIRTSYSVPSVSRSKVIGYINELHKKKIQFNYIINSSCLDNYEWTKSGQKKIRNFLEWLVDIGVDAVTITIPYLAEVIKKDYPSLKVVVSTAAAVDTIAKAKHWEDLGADEITLSIYTNRNFRLLKKIKEKAKCKLRLIANLCCLYQCPYRAYHSVIYSHGAQLKHTSRGFLIDYPALACNHKKLMSPLELIRSPWIRPEDVKYYEDIGIEKIKLVDRVMSIEAILLVYEAYVRRSYDGNLLDLFPSSGKSLILKKPDTYSRLKYLFRPLNINIFKLIKMKELIPDGVFYIENKALDNFILHFMENDCSSMSCDDCRYCYEVADKVIKINQDKRASMAKRYEEHLGELITGGMFKYL